MVSRKQRKVVVRRRRLRGAADIVSSITAQIQRALSNPIVLLLLGCCLFLTAETDSILTKLGNKVKTKDNLKWIYTFLDGAKDKIPHAAWGATIVYSANPARNIGLALVYGIVILVFDKHTTVDVAIQVGGIFLLSAPLRKQFKALVVLGLVALMISGHLLQNIFR